jgi:hypothetical protein
VDDFRQMTSPGELTSHDAITLARAAAEAIRGLNHATRHEAGLGQPSVAYDVLGACPWPHPGSARPWRRSPATSTARSQPGASATTTARIRGVSKNHAMNTAKVSTLLDVLLSHRGPPAGLAGAPPCGQSELRRCRLVRPVRSIVR